MSSISIRARALLVIIAYFTSSELSHSFSLQIGTRAPPPTHLTRQYAVEVAAASLVAGSVAGAIGVGVAHPLDTLNIKVQVRQAALSMEKLQRKKERSISVLAEVGEEEPLLEYNEQIIARRNTAVSADSNNGFLTTMQMTSGALAIPNGRVDSGRQWNDDNFQQLLTPITRTGNELGSTNQGVDERHENHVSETSSRVDTIDIMKQVYDSEGLTGFLGGIRIMMLGQGTVKAVAFTVNSFVLNWLVNHSTPAVESPTTAMFLIAAASAGFASSFIVNPVERVKVLLQASSTEDGDMVDEWQCIQRVLEAEGPVGFLGRGLGTTMLREIPSDAIYFSVYGLLMQAAGGGIGGNEESMMIAPWLASILFGATSGIASWLPVYPVDLVKTLVQNTDGEASEDPNSSTAARSTMQVVQDLFEAGGVGAFYDGVVPKLLRAGLFHAVTFWVYDTILPAIDNIMSSAQVR